MHTGRMQTLTHAWRALRRAPAFAIAAALTLSIGIGATTSIFAVLNTILLEPLAYRDPGRLAGVWFALPGMNFNNAPQSASSYFTFRRLSHLIEGMGVVARNSVNLSTDAAADAGSERVRTAQVSANGFPLLSGTIAIGRAFTHHETGQPGRAVVLPTG